MLFDKEYQLKLAINRNFMFRGLNEETGTINVISSCPVWGMLWAWAMSGGFHTSAINMEVGIKLSFYLCLSNNLSMFMHLSI